MTYVAGVDGYREGWFVALIDVESGRSEHVCAPDFDAVIQAAEKAAIIGVDMPIGLLDQAYPGGRKADIEARRLLGWPRSLSVFTPPVRSALAYDDYDSASQANMDSSPLKISISRQSFGLFKLIREVDAYVSADPARQERIREVHPELSFLEMNGGRALPHGKKSHRGFLERLELLEFEGLGDGIMDLAGFDCDVSTDDVLDAYACCFTARRILESAAIRVPADPPRDSGGIRMQIWR